MKILAFAVPFLLALRFSYASHILYPGETLFPNQSLVSESGEFKFGFFIPRNGSNSPKRYYYVGIWLAYTVSPVQPPTLDETSGVAWVANRENPVLQSEPSVLSLSQNGELILMQSEKLVWSSNVSQTDQSVSSVVLQLLDTGNLIIHNSTKPNQVLWQSFDHPTDTWFPGARLGFTNINGENIERSLVSWKYRGDPSPGMYTLEIDNPISRGFIIKETPNNILHFGTLPDWVDIQDFHSGFITFNYTQSSRNITPYFRLYGTGIFQLIYNYYPLWSSPGADCDFHLDCGPNSLCVDKSIISTCRCPHGFSNMSSEYAASSGNSTATNVGCVRNTSWNCHDKVSHDSNRYSFYLVQDIYRLPDNPQSLGVQSREECERACVNNCSCTAYAPGTACNLWYGDLRNIIVSDGFSGQPLYIRIMTSESTKKMPIIKLIIGGVLLITLAICLILIWIFRARFIFMKSVNDNDQLSIYSYAQIKYATKKFSVALGEGGFGSVFRGRLPNSTEVAVKKLKIVGQEEKQFRSEIQTIGMIRHINLVRLLGFCHEGTRRILVYEYMSNGCLSSRLFKECSSILSWQERYKIAVGIARGLTYLHDECRDCIIHCDIKPENVLLDENLVPKIADFGMAKLLGRDLSRVLTTFRGTMGYLAPEWYSGDAITDKADVYSFGMLLFEIISGKRNAHKFNNKTYPYYPLHAMVKINEGEVLCLVDEKLRGNVNAAELIRACKVAGWCIQDYEAHRPSMRKVVLTLQGVASVGIPPVPGSLWNLMGADDYPETF